MPHEQDIVARYPDITDNYARYSEGNTPVCFLKKIAKMVNALKTARTGNRAKLYLLPQQLHRALNAKLLCILTDGNACGIFKKAV